MFKPNREQKPISTMYSKFARIFGMVMTLVYVGLGIFIMLGAEASGVQLPEVARYALGGMLILYGIVRFVRIYKRGQSNNKRYED